jgi:hypothetical protein
MMHPSELGDADWMPVVKTEGKPEDVFENRGV